MSALERGFSAQKLDKVIDRVHASNPLHTVFRVFGRTQFWRPLAFSIKKQAQVYFHYTCVSILPEAHTMKTQV